MRTCVRSTIPALTMDCRTCALLVHEPSEQYAPLHQVAFGGN